MSVSTLESRKKSQNGVKRLIFCGIAIILQALFMVIVFTKLNAYAPVIDVGTRVFSVILILHIYGQNKTSSMKMPWIILIMAFPIMGVTMYLLVGLNGGMIKMYLRYKKNRRRIGAFHGKE